MKLGETFITYVIGVIGLALVVRNGDKVSSIIRASFGGAGDFATALLNPAAMRVG
jgi:hypothetical protein